MTAQPLDIEPSRGVERDRAPIVGPDLEFQLVRAAHATVLDDRLEQRSSASQPARLGKDRYPELEDPVAVLLHIRMAHHPVAVLENP